MQPIVTPAEMREIDASSPVPLDELIARAGWSVARRARELLGGVYGRRVTVIAGPGNNGADARIAADVLASWGVRVEVVTPEALVLPTADLIIDGAFGTGMNRPFEPRWNTPAAPVLAIDIPSGVSGLTGEPLGVPMAAQATVTFAAYKPGLLLEPGASLAGLIDVVDLGLDTSQARAYLFTEPDAVRSIPRRSATDHKWKRAVWVVGGSPGMHGAPMLASRAALRSGCGIVRCTIPGAVAPAQPSEVVFHELGEDVWAEDVIAHGDRFGAIVVGPGLGRSEQAKTNVRHLIAHADHPLVIDGDALHLVSDGPRLRPDIVLTPHDGEYRALTGHEPGADRFEGARGLAAMTGATVVLKGPLTIVADPGGRCVATNSGDQRLATAGTGDVLSGTIGSYLASGLEPMTAAALGAWMHGAAGETQPSLGMVASDLLQGLTVVTQRLTSSSPEKDSNASD